MATQPPGSPRDVVSSGVVTFRPGKRVLLVHRPRYDDWSFPKGKLERGEHRPAAAVREVAEETGLHVRLGLPLTDQHYPLKAGGMKTVHYWVGRTVGPHDVSGYRPNAEIDQVGWFDLDEARELLTYPYDLLTLKEALKRRRKTHTLVVLRHGSARSRKAWRKDDRRRPLLQSGRDQAQRLVPLLAAYDVRRLVSSSSLRCVETLDPYAQTTGWKLETEDVLSEEDATSKGVRRLVRDVVDDLVDRDPAQGAVVVCTHRPVLPWVTDEAGLDDARLEPGEMLVLHLRGHKVVASERHRVR